MQDMNIAFTLRVRLWNSDKLVTIKAYDDLPFDYRGAVQLTCEVKHGSEVIFPRGQLYCALSPGKCSDGIDAKELILSLVAMAPDAGTGVDEDYWEGYTERQLEWVNTYYEQIDLARQDRYCNEDGSVRS